MKKKDVERYRYIHEWVNSEGEVEVLDEPYKIDLMPERMGKIENLDDNNLFYKIYTNKIENMIRVSSVNGDAASLFLFLLKALEGGKYQTVRTSREKLRKVFRCGKPKMIKMITLLIKEGLILTRTNHRDTHFIVNPDCAWQWGDNLRWKVYKAISGEFKYVNSLDIMSEEEVFKYNEMLNTIKK